MMAWITENWQAVTVIISSTLGVLALICKLTPSPKDDAVVAKILSFLNMIPKAK
jgi:hypothetical protein